MDETILRTSISRGNCYIGDKPGSAGNLVALPHIDIRTGKVSETDGCVL
jgi:peptidase E